MAAVDRVLPWRRHQNVTADELTPLLSAYRRRHPKAPVTMINRAYETAKEAHRHQLARQRRELHQPPAGGGAHRRRHRPRRDLAGGGAAARRRRGHRDHHRRRRDATSAPRSPRSSTASPSSSVCSSTRRRRSRPPRCARCWWRWPATCACSIIKLADRLHNMRTHRGDAQREAAAHRPGDARHLRPAGPSPRHAGAEAAAGRPRVRRRCIRSASPSSITSSARVRPSARSYLAKAIAEVQRPAARAQHRGRGHRSRQAPVEHLREDDRRRAASSTTSSTSSPSASSSIR